MYPRVNFEDGTLVGPGTTLNPDVLEALGRLFGSDGGGVLATLSHWWDIYSLIALALSIIFFVIFIYAKIRYGELADAEQAVLRDAERQWAERYGGKVTRNSRWADIERHIAGNTPNDWKLAIIEADILLEETLSNAGYVGATIGEKLKGANAASFSSLQDAWEAHKVRNQIAHEGGDFILTKRVAQETITRYGRVFREFDII